jgi:ligand-binding SRPBCC domain-containing protein
VDDRREWAVVPEIELDTWIEATQESCFDLSRSVDAHVGSMTRSKERAIGAITTGLLGPGVDVTWEARHFGFRFTMTSRISGFDRPRYFVDEQVDGPFESWWHRHDFEPEHDGTLMIDVVRYSAPGGIPGRLGDRVFLHRYLRGLLDRRNTYLKRILEAGWPETG